MSAPQSTNILVIVAGTNSPSNSETLADAFIEGATQAGAHCTKILLRDLKIHHFTLSMYEEECRTDDDFCRVQELFQYAHGVVFATPIWNFSVPAHLKNFIDRAGAFALDDETHSKGQLQSMPMSFIYTGGAPVIAWKVLLHLTTMHVSEAMKYYGATVIGRHFEQKCMEGKGKFGLVVDKRPASLKNLRQRGERFAKIALHYARTGKLPKWSQMKHDFFTWAYRIGNRIMYPLSQHQ
ncbi:hypothetical protein COU77_04015 [Candidatus Peregrinibacteria bacterium CG10_big_fil_rev_8_21_14_0_10_49_16]|nr:MAG: hypothetical protein COW95_03640 [Candidatus Peregrinibacteria bacterium CG22_combo_CG10-13_8_21_14_all_49_11]PIR51750.1 MAG: hypothetical protein COU77_04015 [Candidatus Peregrinibacteria bacterium CG10_big_fil_rev_8_21_14_0_10_49_16]